MKKVCLWATSILVFILINSPSFAQNNSTTQEEESSINYELPYPGLLPDSPLYFLRVIRDKAVSFLISNPLKQAEFDLLQADKRLNAGIYLFDHSDRDEKKIELSISTISKAENYFSQALENTKKAKEEGMNISQITKQLVDSSAKHEEVLIDLEEKSSKDFKEKFKRERERVVEFQKEASRL